MRSGAHEDGPAVRRRRGSYDDEIVPDPVSEFDVERWREVTIEGRDPALDWDLAQSIEAGNVVRVPDGGRFRVHGVSEPRTTTTKVEVANSTLVRVTRTETVTMRVGPVR